MISCSVASERFHFPTISERSHQLDQCSDGRYFTAWLSGRTRHTLYLDSAESIRGRPSIGHFDREPFCQNRVDFDWSLLGHPMAGEHNDLGEIGAVTTHRFGKAGVDRLAGVVLGAVQKEDGQS